MLMSEAGYFVVVVVFTAFPPSPGIVECISEVKVESQMYPVLPRHNQVNLPS